MCGVRSRLAAADDPRPLMGFNGGTRVLEAFRPLADAIVFETASRIELFFVHTTVLLSRIRNLRDSALDSR